MTVRPLDVPLVITGVGAVGNVGNSVPDIAHHIRRGLPGRFQFQPEFAALALTCHIMGEVQDVPDDAALGIDRRASRFMGRASRLALWASRQALAQSGRDPSDMALAVGSGTGDVHAHIELADRITKTGSARRASPTLIPKVMASTVSANLANVLRMSGPSVTAAAACAGGAWNLAIAASLVASGHAPAALAGGCEIGDPHFYAGFDRMRAFNTEDNDTSERASRPYAADRAGFVFGEAAAMVVIERESDARARGATILGRLLGWGMSSDGQGEMVAPNADGAWRSMRSALAHAGLQPADIGYVNTHATSTPLGDVIEARALRRMFPDGVRYSSTKGYTGHTVSAAGALEAVLTLEMLRDGWVAGCIGASPLDPELADFPPVLEGGPLDARVALSNSFGFGGTNATLVLGAP